MAGVSGANVPAKRCNAKPGLITTTRERRIEMSWKPVFIMNDNERAYNGQRFATQEEARLSADRRFGVWTMPVDFTTEESDDPVNYVFDPIKGDVSVST